MSILIAISIWTLFYNPLTVLNCFYNLKAFVQQILSCVKRVLKNKDSWIHVYYIPINPTYTCIPFNSERSIRRIFTSIHLQTVVQKQQSRQTQLFIIIKWVNWMTTGPYHLKVEWRLHSFNSGFIWVRIRLLHYRFIAQT